MTKYSILKKKLQTGVRKITPNGRVQVAHYYQSHGDGVPQFYKAKGESALVDPHEELNWQHRKISGKEIPSQDILFEGFGCQHLQSQGTKPTILVLPMWLSFLVYFFSSKSHLFLTLNLPLNDKLF